MKKNYLETLKIDGINIRTYSNYPTNNEETFIKSLNYNSLFISTGIRPFKSLQKTTLKN